MTDTTIIQYQPASSPVLSSALTSLEQSLQAAARANVEAVLAASPDNDYTVTEIEAMTLIEQLKQVNGLDLAAVLLRGKYLRQIEATNAIANHPGGYTNLQEMARDQGISVAELSQTLALVNIVFPYVTETLGMNVYTLWEQIGKSNFRELVPALVSIITGEDSNSASVRGSVAAITAEVLEDAGVEEMPEDELRQRTVDQLLTDGAHLTNRQLRERIRPERTQVISLRSSSGGSFDVPSSEPMAIAAVLQAANLAVGQGIEFWVNGTRVESDFVVAPGATINAIGMVKGG